MKLPNKVYDVLKWVALICLPALATFWGVISKVGAPVWCRDRNHDNSSLDSYRSTYRSFYNLSQEGGGG